MLTSDFDYVLPEELIAQKPPEDRGASRMLLLDTATGKSRIVPFHSLPDFLRRGDALVVNNSRVIRARLFAERPSGGRMELFLLERREGVWRCLVKPGRRARAGEALSILRRDSSVSPFAAKIQGRDGGDFFVSLHGAVDDEIIESCGHIPLPPYIKRSDELSDSERYQTVYAKTPGSVAAPTAGLHFDGATLDALKAKGVVLEELTLHVGQGTFKPVDVERIEDHKMHSEDFAISQECAANLNSARLAGGRILAVGTTSLRVLESCVSPGRMISPRSGSTDIFIHPPFVPRAADLLLTNFHLPKSTLLMLVCAFAGSREMVLDAYAFAVRERMRFFSYGDCMLVGDLSMVGA